MAERRMLAKTITESDAFLDMPQSSQNLYFHLNMNADDEGFVNSPKKVQRTIGASDDDARLLVAKMFIIPFESGVVVIKHWRIHNYIRGDRLQETKYQEERRKLVVKDNGAYTLLGEDEEEPKKLEDKTDRQLAYENSSLPYSFSYKIRQAFYGKKCPICGSLMSADSELGRRNRIPTIQHNVPISKGGEHELGNISVICKQCNVSIRDKETGELNSKEVVEVWDSLMSGKCQASDRQVSAEIRVGEDRVGEDREREDPVFSKTEALNPNKRTSEQLFQQYKTTWNDNCRPKCKINSTLTMTRDEQNDWSVIVTRIDDPFRACKAIQNYGGICGDPKYEAKPGGYHMLGFLLKGVEVYADDANPFETMRIRSGPAGVTSPEEVRAMLAKFDEEDRAKREAERGRE